MLSLTPGVSEGSVVAGLMTWGTLGVSAEVTRVHLTGNLIPEVSEEPLVVRTLGTGMELPTRVSAASMGHHPSRTRNPHST